jgi:hypothetical protein
VKRREGKTTLKLHNNRFLICASLDLTIKGGLGGFSSKRKQHMYLDNSNIKQVSNRHLKKIRSKKTGKGTDIFRLIPELSVTSVPYKSETVIRTAPTIKIDNLSRSRQALNSLKRVVEQRTKAGKRIKLRTARRYVFYAGELNEVVPPFLLEICANKKPFLRKKGKHKQLIKFHKKERCPRTYKEYIKSKFWEERKNSFYKTVGRLCAVCGSTNQMSVHHLKYGKFGKERDEDLVALCWSCHEEFHTIYGVTKDCNKEFAEFCASKVNNVGYLTVK